MPAARKLFGSLRYAKEFPLLAAVAALCLCLWAFAGIAEEVHEGEKLHLDTVVLRAFRQPGDLARLRGPAWGLQMTHDISALGGATVLVLLTLLVLGYLLLIGRRRTAAFFAASIAGAYVVSASLKLLFSRPRPTLVPALAEVNSASFPSGHSLLSSAVYLTLGALLARTVARRREKSYFLGAAMLLTLLVGLSRVLLGVHYPTDVLAGWAAGAAWALVCWLVAYWLQRRGMLRTPPGNSSQT